MPQAPIILVDMDGVLCNTDEAFWDAWEATYPAGPTRSDRDPAIFGSERQLGAHWAAQALEVICSDGFFRSIPPVPGALSALGEMAAAGLQVWVCSTPQPASRTCASDKLAWLRAHLGDGWAERAILTADKGLVIADVLIDDKPFITSVTAPRWQHVVFDASYNQRSTSSFRLHEWTAWRPVVSAALAAARGCRAAPAAASCPAPVTRHW